MEGNIGKLEGLVEGLQVALGQLNKTLYGNGQPGIMDRLTRAEDKFEKLTDIIQKDKEGAMNNIEEIKGIIAEQKRISELSNLDLRNLIERQEGIVKDQAKAVKEQTLVVTTLTDLMNKHIENKNAHTLKGLFLNREALLYVVLAFIFLNSILPKFSLEQMGAAILKFLGI